MDEVHCSQLRQGSQFAVAASHLVARIPSASVAETPSAVLGNPPERNCSVAQEIPSFVPAEELNSIVSVVVVGSWVVKQRSIEY